MKNLRIIGSIVAAAGVVMLAFSSYIRGEVAAGREEISSAKQKVNTANSVFSLSSATKPIGKQLSKSANKKIQAGTEEADQYEKMANQLKIGGIIALVVGAGLFAYSFKKSGR